MQKAYKILAHTIAGLVTIQAAVMVFAVAGLFYWIEEDEGFLDKGVIEGWDADPPTWMGAIGVPIHGMSGMFLIPLLGLVLLIISFFAKVNGGTKWAGIVFGLIIVQVALGIFAHGAPALGLLHGINAFLLFFAALSAGRAAKESRVAEPAMVG